MKLCKVSLTVLFLFSFHYNLAVSLFFFSFSFFFFLHSFFCQQFSFCSPKFSLQDALVSILLKAEQSFIYDHSQDIKKNPGNNERKTLFHNFLLLIDCFPPLSSAMASKLFNCFYSDIVRMYDYSAFLRFPG